MRYWVHEIAGWLLVALGLLAFYACYQFLLLENRIIESGPLMIIGIFLFRGGLHLVKIAVAAHVAGQTQDRLAPERAPTARAWSREVVKH
jgi:hypothetical protein